MIIWGPSNPHNFCIWNSNTTQHMCAALKPCLTANHQRFNGIIEHLILQIMITYNITQRYGPSKYNNGMMRVQHEYESPCAPL
jgi:hypothetical protein